MDGQKLIVGFFAAIVVGLLAGLPVMLLWNWLCPVLFKLPSINFLQALGLSLLSGFLFKSH